MSDDGRPRITRGPVAPGDESPLWDGPIGFWRVSTVDTEMRDVPIDVPIGDYYGHIVELAFHLGEREQYKLTFQRLRVPDGLKVGDRVSRIATRDEVEVDVRDAWRMQRAESLEYVKRLLACDDVEFVPTRFGWVRIRLREGGT